MESESEAVRQELFQIVYDGPDVQDGSISAKDFVEAVSGLNRAVGIITGEYDDLPQYQVRIRDLEHASAHIVFELVAFTKANPLAASVLGAAATASAKIAADLATSSVSGAYKVLTDLGVIMEVKKKLARRRVARQSATFPDGLVELETGSGTVTLTKEQYEVLLSQRVDRPISQIVSPLNDGRIDGFSLRRGTDHLADVNASQKDAFDFLDEKQDATKEGTEISGVLNSLNKTNLRGTFHTVEGLHVPYKYSGGDVARLLRGFTSREPIKVTGRVIYGADNVPKLIDVKEIDFLQARFPNT